MLEPLEHVRGNDLDGPTDGRRCGHVAGATVGCASSTVTTAFGQRRARRCAQA
jgi:hypothetical protein